MRYIFYCFIILSSCQSKNNLPNYIENHVVSDTGVLVIDSLNPVGTDSPSVHKPINNRIFLGFRIGMTRFEYEKHKEELVQKRKLKVSDNGLVYQIKIDISNRNPFSFDNVPEKIWTGNGIVIPEFFDNKLISITIKFLNTKGFNVFWFFNLKLDEKYYKSTPQLYNLFVKEDEIPDTLQVGNSIYSNIKNNWQINGINNISLRIDIETLKVSDSKFKKRESVFLKYWSEYYYDQRKNKKVKEEKKEVNEAINDL
jgi:hypothetical protein